MTRAAARRFGFTLIELLVALLILSVLALMSYRGLSAVLDARDHVIRESDKWRHVAAFLGRFERDINLAAPRSVRSGAGAEATPAWLGRPGSGPEPRLEASRFATAEGVDAPRRFAYRLNENHQIELWLWPGLDLAPGVRPARYPVLSGVTAFELQYLDGRAWVAAWPARPGAAALPRGLRLRLVLASGETIVRVFALNS